MVWTRDRGVRRAAIVVAGGGLVVLSVVLTSVAWVRATASGHLYAEADLPSVPAAPVALVLGAQVYPSGRPSAFLAARLDLARRLHDLGLVRTILVSGDHAAPEHDEPRAMRDHLVASGVPAERVVLDPGGLDTYDSAVRAREVFGLSRVLVVTQGYHLPRAVATCRAVGLDADGVGDDTVRGSYAWRRGWARDQLACVKTVVDVASRRAPASLDGYRNGVMM